MNERIETEFILHFGEMGSRWGINRTVGQIYAALFLSERPLCADDLCERLSFSRSNVSMGLKELQGWNLVRRRHIEGDRRDHFVTPDDLWQIVRILVEERKKREIDPTLTKLRELELDAGENSHATKRIAELRVLIETMATFYEDMKAIDNDRLQALLMAGSKLAKLVTVTGQMTARVMPTQKKESAQ